MERPRGLLRRSVDRATRFGEETKMKHRLINLMLAGVAVALTACSESANAGGNGSIGGPPSPISVDQAMQSPGTGPMRVRGALVVQGGGVVMCDALAESYPPQCINGVALTGFAVERLPADAQRAIGVRWVDSVEMIVHRDGGGLRAADNTGR
jgi:hypothetical protein